MRRREALAAALLAAALLAGPARAAGELPTGGLLRTPFGAALAARLAGDGFDRARVEALLGDGRAGINETTLAYAIVYREKPADYSPFLSEERLGRARDFLRERRGLLEAAEERTGVPAEVIAAILMIESDFGNYRKLHGTLNVFLTLLWADESGNEPVVREVIRRRIPEVTDEKVRERARRKAAWAYGQLKDLLRIAEREGTDPFAIEGSWAGAFGMPQFIPSSYLGYAVDGGGDGKVDLYDPADAVFSVGNYLERFGWKPDLPEAKRHAVIKRYNNSDLYASTVLAAAARLAGEPAP